MVKKKKAKNQITNIGIFAIGLAFILLSFMLYREQAKQENWDTTKGIIISSKLVSEVSNTKEGTKVRELPDIKYRYMVNGVEYQASNYGVVSKTAEEIVLENPVGKEVDVHYDPDDPQKAVLSPGIKWVSVLLFLVLGVIIVLIGIAGIVFSTIMK